MSELIELDEVARRLRMPYRYVRDRLLKSGRFPAPALNLSQRMRRWDVRDVDAWLERERQEQAR